MNYESSLTIKFVPFSLLVFVQFFQCIKIVAHVNLPIRHSEFAVMPVECLDTLIMEVNRACKSVNLGSFFPFS